MALAQYSYGFHLLHSSEPKGEYLILNPLVSFPLRMSDAVLVKKTGCQWPTFQLRQVKLHAAIVFLPFAPTKDSYSSNSYGPNATLYMFPAFFISSILSSHLHPIHVFFLFPRFQFLRSKQALLHKSYVAEPPELAHFWGRSSSTRR